MAHALRVSDPFAKCYNDLKSVMNGERNRFKRFIAVDGENYRPIKVLRGDQKRFVVKHAPIYIPVEGR